MKKIRIVHLLIAFAGLGILAPTGRAQSAAAGESSSGNLASIFPAAPDAQPILAYTRPTEKIKVRNYLFDTFGPYAFAGAAVSAGFDQASKTPPEWGQGAGPYAERFASDFGIAMVTTSTRYALSEAFRDDTLYYRCQCRGVFRRMDHAVISTVTARHGDDGHRRLSFPALIAPYAGSLTAIYGWYPSGYGAQDAMRMGNYTLLAFVGENIAREFIYGGPHTLLGRMDRSSSRETYSAVDSLPLSHGPVAAAPVTAPLSADVIP
jgi:hypothetical protein